jgi:hypothetical protein
MSKHIYDYKKQRCSSREILQFEDAKIELLESVDCLTKKELHEREQYYIDLNNTVNLCNASSKKTPEKIASQNANYRQDNKEKIAIQKAKYRQDNKAEIAIYDAKYYQDNKAEIAKYYLDNKETIAIRKAKYYQENKLKNSKKWDV